MPLASTPTLPLPPELRLAVAVLITVTVVVAAWRFCRRRLDAPAVDVAADALLLNFVVQYVSVALPGLLGVLSPLTIFLAALVLSAALFFAPAADRTAALPSPGDPVDRNVLLACVLFGVGYLGALVSHQRIVPVMSNDAITYHFPAAVHWLRTGGLSLYEAWFFNPANTYSPLAGSTFVAWYVAPMGNDVVARFVQFPAVVLIFLATLRLGRSLGARTAVAAVAALALILSKAVVRQSIIEKDDLYVAAFFAAAVAACAPDRLRDRLGAWRVGAALGMLVATKYTALLTLPVLLLLIDAPFRARWRVRQYAVAFALLVVLAGPWYLRNAIITGNPLYPVDVRVFGRTLFAGLFTSAPDSELRSARSVMAALVLRDQSLPPIPTILAVVGYLAACAAGWRRLRADPLWRICLAGPPLALAVFVLASPHPEARYFFPGYVLLVAACVIAVARWLRSAYQLAAALVLLAACVVTGFAPVRIAEFAPVGLAVALLGFAARALYRRTPSPIRPTVLRYTAVGAATAAALVIYVQWNAYLLGLRENAHPAYGLQYEEAAVWNFIRQELPRAEALAYANTFLVHPMSGFDHTRPLLYIPTRSGITHIHDLPRLSAEPIPGERIIPTAAAALTSDPDPAGWLDRLLKSPATHVVVFHHQVLPNPPELVIIRNHADRFEQRYSDAVATVYRLRK